MSTAQKKTYETERPHPISVQRRKACVVTQLGLGYTFKRGGCHEIGKIVKCDSLEDVTRELIRLFALEDA